MRNTTVAVNGPEGASASVRTDERGSFKIEDSPLGSGTVTLPTDENHLWPITTEPQQVYVESLREVSGVTIGSASRAVYDSRTMSISGIIFDDANENGLVDVDECPISPRVSAFDVRSGDRLAFIDPTGAFELKNLPQGHPREVTAGLRLSGINGVPIDPLAVSAGPFRPTNGTIREDSCAPVFRAKPRYAPNIFEANLGFSGKRGDSVVSGVVFNDTNANGDQDSGEEPVVGIYVRLYATGECPIEAELAASTDSDGIFTIRNVHAGTYRPQVDVNPIGEYLSDFVTVRLPLVTVTVESGAFTEIDIPVKVGPPGTIRVTVFDDNDGDGIRDAGEGSAPGVQVCAMLNDPLLGFYSPYGNCIMTGADGAGVIGNLPEALYEITLFAPFSGEFSEDETSQVSVLSAEELALIFGLDITTATEQVIPVGSGSPVELRVCYSDPAFTLPDFDSRWNSTLMEMTGYDTDAARRAYQHGIYLSYYGEVFVWSEIAGVNVRTLAAICGEARPGRVYILIGYEPIGAVLSDEVTQIRLAPRATGLYASFVPESWPIHLFVDETLTPIVRCSNYAGCEWNDGTRPVYPEGGPFIFR